jgi:hypothetical protein
MNVHYVISLKLSKAKLLCQLGRYAEFKTFVRSLFRSILSDVKGSGCDEPKFQYRDIVQQMIEIVDQVEQNKVTFNDLSELKGIVVETRTLLGL